MTTVLFVLLFVFLIGSVPIFIALAGSTAVSFAIFSDLDLIVVVQRMMSGVNKFSLISIPLFILAANLMGEGGISKRIINLANLFVGRIPGGLGLTAVMACLFFGAISGSAPATVVAIGTILYPALREAKYSTEYSIGVITASGSLGILIPPSVTMIVFGTVTGASVGALFMSGIGAGLIYALLFMAYTVFYGVRHKDAIVKPHKMDGKQIKDTIIGSLWGMGLPIIILGGIYSGIFTPTEASAVAVIYALIISLFVYDELDWKGVIRCIRDSAVTTVQIMILMAGAAAFAWILTSEGVTVRLAEGVLGATTNPMAILLLMVAIMLVAGMFLDGSSFVTILAPLFLPIAQAVGIDIVHLGVVMVTSAAVGMVTPPFGLNLFVASGITKQPVLRVAKGSMPFILLSIAALLLITLVPSISLLIPRIVYGVW